MNTRADFYLLGTSEQQQTMLFACRLLEKAYQQKNSVYIYCQNRNVAHHIDELLWTFREDSFIPHNLIGEGPANPPTIQIGFDNPPKHQNDILLSLHEELPAFYGQFKRLVFLVSNDPDTKSRMRTIYSALNAQNLPLYTHDLTKK